MERAGSAGRSRVGVIAALTALLCLPACSVPGYHHEDGPVGPQTFQGDLSYCNAMANGSDRGGWMGLAMFMQAKDQCMAGRGYSRI